MTRTPVRVMLTIVVIRLCWLYFSWRSLLSSAMKVLMSLN